MKKRILIVVLFLVAAPICLIASSGQKESLNAEALEFVTLHNPMLQAGTHGVFGRVTVKNEMGTEVVDAGANDNGIGGAVWVKNNNGSSVVVLRTVFASDSLITTGDGLVLVMDSNQNVRVTSFVNKSDAGEVAVMDSSGNIKYSMDAAFGFASWGGDIAENFVVGTNEITPGAIMVLDAENPDQLKVSEKPYDRLVAGVVSGANGYRPGMTLAATKQMDAKRPVTLTGTVYALVTNENGPVQVGDLLTTSSLPGYAMKATDFEASQGSILGKAMEALDGETGLVKILVTLQ